MSSARCVARLNHNSYARLHKRKTKGKNLSKSKWLSWIKVPTADLHCVRLPDAFNDLWFPSGRNETFQREHMGIATEWTVRDAKKIEKEILSAATTMNPYTRKWISHCSCGRTKLRWNDDDHLQNYGLLRFKFGGQTSKGPANPCVLWVLSFFETNYCNYWSPYFSESEVA